MSDRTDIEEIHRLLNRYQQAHKEQDWDAVRACHDESYFRWFGCKSTDPMDWVPHLFLMQSEMQEWGETRMPEGAHYEQEQEILKTEDPREHGHLRRSGIGALAVGQRRGVRPLGRHPQCVVHRPHQGRVEDHRRLLPTGDPPELRRSTELSV